jgi:hypothetical protein
VRKGIVPLLALLSPLLVAAAESSFFRTTVTMMSGRPLMPKSITVEEVDRTTTESIVEVSTSADAADLIPGAALIGLCGLARHRGERYIQATQISNSPATFEVTFPKVGSNSATPPTSAMAPNVFPVANCPTTP